MSALRFTKQALQDLVEIDEYITKANPAAAVSFIHRLRESCALLASSPGIGGRRNEVKPNLRSSTEGNYIIFYRQRKKHVQIVRVVHGKRDWRRISFS